MTLLPMPEDEGSIIPVCGMTCIPALRRVAHVGKTDSVNTQKLSSQIGVGIGIAIGIENGISSEPDSDSDTDPECCATAGQIPPSRMFFRSVPPPAAPVCPCWKNRFCVDAGVIEPHRGRNRNRYRNRTQHWFRTRSRFRYRSRMLRYGGPNPAFAHVFQIRGSAAP